MVLILSDCRVFITCQLYNSAVCILYLIIFVIEPEPEMVCYDYGHSRPPLPKVEDTPPPPRGPTPPPNLRLPPPLPKSLRGSTEKHFVDTSTNGG